MKCCGGATAIVAASHFAATVTSRGQHDIPWLGEDFPSLGFTGDLPPDWQQCSAFVIGLDWCWSAKVGSAQPMKHARTPIHRDTNVAIHALNVCNGGFISFSLYPSMIPDNLVFPTSCSLESGAQTESLQQTGWRAFVLRSLGSPQEFVAKEGTTVYTRLKVVRNGVKASGLIFEYDLSSELRTMKLILTIAVRVFLGIMSLSGCNSSPPPATLQTENPKPITQEQKLDIGAWYIQEPRISPIDGTKTQMLSTGPVGRRLVLCFENGKLCGGNNIGVFVTSPCWVDGGEETGTRYKRRVRLRFDMDKFLVEIWGISDDHRGIFPYSPKNFISSLKTHKSLAVEFGCDRSDSDVVTFDIHGLQAAIESAGLKQ